MRAMSYGSRAMPASPALLPRHTHERLSPCHAYADFSRHFAAAHAASLPLRHAMIICFFNILFHALPR